MRALQTWALVQAWTLITPIPAAAALQDHPGHASPFLKPESNSHKIVDVDSDVSPKATVSCLHESKELVARQVPTPPAQPPAPPAEPAPPNPPANPGRPLPPVPDYMGWMGSIGGLLGTISFAEGFIRKMVTLFIKASKQQKQHYGPPPWVVGIQVGLDGAGLEGADGDFPQVCLWNAAGKLLGWSDQKIYFRGSDMQRLEGAKGWDKYSLKRPKDMPHIQDGGREAVGIWPPPNKWDLRQEQAAYVTMVKRHFNPICIASVHVQWPDETRWVLDGNWGRPANASWYLSHVYDSDARQRECFWLDQAGFLDNTQGRTDYIVDGLGDRMMGWVKIPKWNLPKWLWNAAVVPAKGTPEGDDLSEGMKGHGVDKGRVPMGVKFMLPAFKADRYQHGGFDNLTVDDFAGNPGKLKFFWDFMHEGDNPVFPILDMRDDVADPHGRLTQIPPGWDDEVPVDCLTDWYYDKNGDLVNPSSGERCTWRKTRGNPVKARKCIPGTKKRDAEETPSVSLHKRFARTLVVDTTSKGGSAVENLCADSNSVGPSYASHVERSFCRMTDHTLWPFCDEDAGVTKDCFDETAEVLVEEAKGLTKREVHWDEIQDWSHGGKVFGRSLGVTGEPVLRRK